MFTLLIIAELSRTLVQVFRQTQFVFKVTLKHYMTIWTVP